ncbi:MAG: hypothetical protein V7K73_00500 [Nostoc sp.]
MLRERHPPSPRHLPRSRLPQLPGELAPTLKDAVFRLRSTSIRVRGSQKSMTICPICLAIYRDAIYSSG